MLNENNLLVDQLEVWGESAVFPGNPGISVFEDVILTPFSRSIYYDHDPGWGVYGSDGELLADASLQRGDGAGRIGQSQNINWRNDIAGAETLEGEFVYGGPIINHFGHFICSTLARLWWLVKESIGTQKILFHGGADLSEEMALEHVSLCFDALGLNLSNAAVIGTPTRLASLRVPKPALVEQSFGYSAYRDLCHMIGESHWTSCGLKSTRPIYLSKTQLPAGIRKIEQEPIIESILASAGVQIIYPEKLSFSEQIKIFSEARTILGSVGTAFHTSIFAPPNSKIICLSPVPVSANQLILDKLNGTNARYLKTSTPTLDLGLTGDFHSVIRLQNPEEVAKALLSLI